MIKWPKINSKLWKKSKEISFENVICKNCETQFDGKFCPECGQSIKDYDQPFSFIFFNFAGDFFAFDTRFFRTFAALVIKPGFLTKEYFEGRRIKYAPPFRIFIFVSFILFFLLQTYTNRGLTTVLDSSLQENGIIRLDSISIEMADSILSEVITEIDSTQEENVNFKIDLETFRDTRDLRSMLGKLAVSLEKKLEVETDQKEKEKFREYIAEILAAN